MLAVNNFANPISFLCGAIEAASRLNADKSSKLCAQYLAPIVKNRQMNFPPLGENLFVGAQARPNELTYSEDRMRPDFVPPAGATAGGRAADAGDHGSRRRPARHDAAGRRGAHDVDWPSPLRRRAHSACSLVVAGSIGLRVARLELAADAGHRGTVPGSFLVQAQLPDVRTIQPNSRVRVGDVNVGTITKIERQGWHALVTMRLNGDVDLPANATATIGQTSLLGSLHIELGPPTARAAGQAARRSLIPLVAGAPIRTPIRRWQHCRCCSTAAESARCRTSPRRSPQRFAGREDDLRSLIEQLDQFIGRINAQTGDIIAATESLNGLVGQFADQKPVLDKAMETIPDALAVLSDERENLAEAVDRFGKFSALTADSVNQTKRTWSRNSSSSDPFSSRLPTPGPP